MVSYDLAKLRVLAVDDSWYMIRIIRALLEAMGITSVLGVHTADEVFAALKDWHPDLIITDHLMEPVDGLALIEQIRLRESGPNRYIPIILLTGNAKMAVVKEARHRVGADAVLVKPVSVARLHACIVSLYESPRGFIATETYFGPDRRTQDRPFEGQDQREKGGTQDQEAVGWETADDLVFVDRQGDRDDRDPIPAAGKRQ